MSARVLLAGLFHETHTFLTEKTNLVDFLVARDLEILAMEGDGSPTAGFLSVARTHQWTVLPTVDFRAMPSGLVSEEVIDTFWEAFSSRAKQHLRDGVDAIFLILHGAMVSEHTVDVEGELLARIRQLPGAGRLPIFAVLDLHANVSPRMAQHADCLVSYRANPHTDAHHTACRAAELLARCLTTKQRPKNILRRLPIVWTPPGTGTATDPMLSLTLMATKLEAMNDDIWAVSIAPGFSFADTPDTGLSIIVSGYGDESQLASAADPLIKKAWDQRTVGEVVYPAVDEVLRKILPIKKGPIVLVEPSDNIGGGAPGDGTGILRALLDHNIADSLVVINDPASVQRARTVAINEDVSLEIGGRGSPLDAGPVPLIATLVSISDGRFELEDIHSHLASMLGRHIDMGPCAVVRHRGITILLTSNKTPPFDLGQLRSQGIEPLNYQVIGVKAAVAHQRAYNPIAKASYFVDTPGPCSSRLTNFTFTHLARPVFPLDADANINSRT